MVEQEHQGTSLGFNELVIGMRERATEMRLRRPRRE